jgi:hypothetical protein
MNNLTAYVFNYNLNIQSSDDLKFVVIHIVDLSGRILHNEQTNLSAGEIKLLPIYSLKQEIYLARIYHSSDTKPEIFKFFK